MNFRSILRILVDRVNEVRYFPKLYYVNIIAEDVTNITALLCLRYNYPNIDSFL